MLAFAFLYPAFLIGLVAVAAPVLIHLIHRRRTRPIEFPTLRFLKLVEKRIARRRRLEELLVLLLRAAAVALLALGLAAPVARTGGGGRVAVARVLVIDNSMSMGLSPAGGESVLARAMAAADALLEPLGAQDAAVAIPLHPLPQGARLSRDVEAVRASLSRVRPSLGDTPLEEGVRRAIEALADAEATVKDLVIFSDLQARALERLSTSRLLERLPEDTRLFFVAPPARRIANLGVEAIAVRPLAAQARGHRVLVSVANRSSLESGAVLELELEGAVAARREIHLAPGGVGDYAFDLKASGQRATRGVARLSGDELVGDDARWFVLPERRAVPVLVISDAPTRLARLDPSFYLERAMGSGDGATIAPEVVRSDEAVALDLAGYGAVVVADPSDLPVELVAALLYYLELGGGVAVFLGPAAEAGPLGGERAGAGLGGIALVEVVGEGEERFALHAVERRHGVLLPLLATTPPVDLARPRFYRYWRLGELPPGARVLARLGAGDPAIVEVELGRGRLLLLSSTANPEWNDLAWRVAYVPLLHSAIHHLAERSVPGGVEWVVARPAVLSWPREEEAPLRLAIEFEGERRELEPRIAAGGAEVRCEPWEHPGVAELELVTRQGKARRLVAINVDPSESDLARGDPDALPGEVVRLEDPGTVARVVDAGLAGLSLADPFIVAALLLLLGEGLLASRAVFGRGRS